MKAIQHKFKAVCIVLGCCFLLSLLTSCLMPPTAAYYADGKLVFVLYNGKMGDGFEVGAEAKSSNPSNPSKLSYKDNTRGTSFLFCNGFSKPANFSLEFYSEKDQAGSLLDKHSFVVESNMCVVRNVGPATTAQSYWVAAEVQ
ncbi:MAG: hypothetical protein EP343_02760 [Deltaproteobacteria bacterium]|nr:MAG: hypothetical protein EP343_02760 [Deltaproteobacteria bacterium]